MTRESPHSGDPQFEADLIEFEAELGRRSMREFFKLAFHVVEPSTKLIHCWAQDAVCDHLEAVGRGEIQWLAIAIPPRNLKSTASALWLPWMWTWQPAWRGIFSSYVDSLSVRDSIKARNVVASDWYKARFCGPSEVAPGGWSLRDDMNTQSAFGNVLGGHRLALTVGAKATGEGAFAILTDDPCNLDQVRSRADRERMVRWWFETMSTRVDNPKTGAFVIIQQRLDPEDLIGVALAKDLGYEYLCILNEHEPARKFVTYKTDRHTGLRVPFWTDPRTAAGKLLCEERFDAAAVERKKKEMGPGPYRAQFQQDPKSHVHSMFKPDMWRFWRPDGRAAGEAPRPDDCLKEDVCPAVELPKAFERIVVTVDLTLLGEAATDFSVIQAWAALGPDRYLLEQQRGKFGVSSAMERLKDMRKTRYPDAKIYIEESVVGPAVVELLRKEIQGVVSIKTQGAQGGKTQRAASVQMQVEGGNVFLPDGAWWLNDFVDEMASFPGSHDDIVDCAVHAMREMTETFDGVTLLPNIKLMHNFSLWGGQMDGGGGGGGWNGGRPGMWVGGGPQERTRRGSPGRGNFDPSVMPAPKLVGSAGWSPTGGKGRRG